ncbi:hypothetical protein [Paenibacillus piscarius]|uniref:hypothetical protein n=1 Tax=Paenibacillus piscarius TaxID=1089681 RepID=UPI001EE9A87E|nr:hypothetical protein [Paenibacillus piscarius]
MKTTGNLGLKKPDGTDIVDITDLNGNMDILDTAVKAVQDHTADTVKHITAAERSTWNAKASTAVATTTAAGLMAAADKSKLDSVAQGANNYVHPNHTGDVTSSSDGVTAIAPGVIVNADINASAGIDASKIGTGVVSNTEFGYLDGVTSGIQGQLNAALPKAGGSMAGDITMTTPAAASSWSKVIRYQYRDAANIQGERTLGVNTAGKLMFSIPSVRDNPVVLETNGDVTYYVRTDGNDNNTGLANTTAGAFKTIGKAINMIPKNVNHTITVYVSPGTYIEEIRLSGFIGGGSINFIGDNVISTSRTVDRIIVNGCNIIINFTGFNCSTATGNAMESISSTGAVFTLINAIATGTASAGIGVNLGSARFSGCNISNKLRVASVVNAGMAYIENTTGSGNTNGYVAELAGVIGWAGTRASSTNGEIAQAGGFVHTDLLNPWGDNTTASRSFSRATSGVGVQNLAANTWTKAQYPLENNDHLNEYDTGLSRFVAKQSGVYQINATALLNNGGTAAEMVLYANGSFYQRLDYCYVTSGFSYELKGSACVEMSAGDYLEIYVRSSTANTLSTGWEGAFAVSRIS